MFLYKMLKKIFPKDVREKNTEPELHESTQKAKLAVERYEDTSHAVQKEIKRNHFAKYLIYSNENYTDQGEEKHETK